MTNKQVIVDWIKSCKSKKTGKFHGLPEWHATANVHCSSKRLYSYAMPIAEYRNGKFYITNVKYSVTTTKHCGLLKSVLGVGNYIVVDGEIKEN